ncbi:hypothetical protein [Microbacterium sp. 22296]|uniref:hypothetical protein n=1 Tax=Microbacterium sp. 22296 TaxID=3453903 RepID=UPI003F86576E
MSKRDDGVSRRLRWAGLLAAVLILGTGTAAAHGFWRNQSPLTAGPVASGSLDLSTQWGSDWSRWTPLFPGRSADTAMLRVRETAATGTTLRWRLSATPAVSAAFAPFVTMQVFVGACGSATTIPAGGSYAPPGGLLPGQSVDLCLRVTLNANAPTALQGAPLTPSLAVTADQVMS